MGERRLILFHFHFIVVCQQHFVVMIHVVSFFFLNLCSSHGLPTSDSNRQGKLYIDADELICMLV